MSSNCSKGPTIIDFIHAFAFANAQVNKMKCEDKEIKADICKNDVPDCIKWRQDSKKMYFPPPANYYKKKCNSNDDCYLGKCVNGSCTCSNDEDCGNLNCLPDPNNVNNLLCGFAPDNVAAGNCIIATRKTCLDQSELPYTCNCGPHGNSDGECKMKDKKDLNKAYTEWHVDPETGEGKCVLGNFLLKQWCENPCTRCPKDDNGNYPPGCKGDSSHPGITNVPPFYYDDNSGNCYMTHDYCDKYGLRFNRGPCKSNDDCHDGDICQKSGTDKPHCTGPKAKCRKPSGGDQFGQFVLGKTLFYLFQKGFRKCVENYENKDENICAYFDNKHKQMKKILPDFVGKGINLYLYETSAGKLLISFDPKELEKKFPQIVDKESDGTYAICVSKKDFETNKDIRKIYFILTSSTWLTEMVVKSVFK